MKIIAHLVVGTVALLTMVTFWVSTLISEIFLNHVVVLAVKQAIVYGLCLLIPAIAMTGILGFLMSKDRNGRLIEQKKKRMRFIMANGLLILIPCALFLSHQAAAGEFDQYFYSVQILELIVGTVQIVLMGLNFRDGLILGRGIHANHNR